MPQHIGVVACSAEGAALCYTTICTEGPAMLGAHAHPEVTINTPSLARYMEHIGRDDWQGVGAMMLSSAQKLAAIGADFLICPDNTIHQAFPYVEPRSPLPWLHIADAVTEEALRRGYERIAILGTRWLVLSGVYPERFEAQGLSYARPVDAEREEINRIIMDELVYGVFEPSSTAYIQRAIDRMKNDDGCDAVLLGCTELPLILSDGNSPLPVLDSTRLLARAALRRAVETAGERA